MQINRNLPARRKRLAYTLLAATLTLLSAAPSARAQDAHTDTNTTVRTFYLTNAAEPHDANDILIALRNMLEPHDKIYLVNSQNAIVVEASPDQIALAQKLLHELDHPRKLYRLTYTVTTMEGSKSLSTARYSLVAADGQRTTMKQGSKIPVVTGTTTSAGGAQTQYQYLDIGMNFDATVTGLASGVWLKTKVEQSSLTPEKSDAGIPAAGIPDPIVHQTVTEGTALLVPGKPLVLGSLDIPDTTHRLKIEVTADLIP